MGALLGVLIYLLFMWLLHRNDKYDDEYPPY